MSTAKWIWAAVLAGVIFASGYELHRTGRPYNGLLFNAHKLLALAAVVLLVLTLVRGSRTGPLGAGWAAAAAAGVFVLGLFVTGALHSIEATGGLATMGEGARTAVRLIHKVFPYLAALFSGVTLYLLRR